MKNLLLSAAIGDIEGSVYEGRYNRTKNYDEVQMFHPLAQFTDDTVCTFACAEALICHLDMSKNLWKRGRQHRVGYGGRFRQWLESDNPQPYESWGNGSAMRCSAAGWLAKTEEECIQLATATAIPTHNHPEGIKGAVVAALTTFFLKEGKDKEFIRKEVLGKYYPEWAEKPYASFHPYYKFDVSYQGSVPQAIICALKATDFEDAVRNAISIGGDSDTIGCITGSIAEALYGIPQEIREKEMCFLDEKVKAVVAEFEERFR